MPGDHPAIAKLHRWLHRRLRLAYEFALIRQTLTAMDSHCPKPEQIRYYWDGITALLARTEATRRLSEKLATAKPLRDPPFIPKALREACSECNGYLAKAMLWPDDNHATAPVQPSLYGVDHQCRLPWDASISLGWD